MRSLIIIMVVILGGCINIPYENQEKVEIIKLAIENHEVRLSGLEEKEGIQSSKTEISKEFETVGRSSPKILETITSVWDKIPIPSPFKEAGGILLLLFGLGKRKEKPGG